MPAVCCPAPHARTAPAAASTTASSSAAGRSKARLWMAPSDVAAPCLLAVVLGPDVALGRLHEQRRFLVLAPGDRRRYRGAAPVVFDDLPAVGPALQVVAIHK